MRPTIRMLLASISAATAVHAAPSLAADEDTQFWANATVTGEIAKDVKGTFEVSPRLRENGDQLLNRATVDFKLSDPVSLGGGVAYVISDGSDEFRTFQQLTLSSGVFSARTRFEERFFDGADHVELRLRQRLMAKVPVAEKWQVTGAGELLYVLQQETIGDDPAVDSWRFTLATHYQATDRLEIAGGYMLMLAPRQDQPDKISHVPQVVLTLKL